MLDAISDHINGFAAGSLTTVIGVLIVFCVGTIIIRALTKLMGRIMKKSGKLDPSLQSFIVTAVRVVGLVVNIIICAEMLSVPTASLITLLGTLGLAISLSLQDLVANIAGGIFLMTSRPFKTGDWIEADGTGGTVVKIGLIHTAVIPISNNKVFIPNGKLMSSVISNYSTEPKRRIALTIPVSYECSTAEARKIIYETVCREERVMKDPEPFVRVWGLSASSVDICVRVWTKSSDYWEVRSALIENIKNALDENGIAIPFNQLTVSFANKKEDNN